MPDGDSPPTPTTLRMRDPGGPVTVPVTLQLPYSGLISLGNVQNSLMNFQLQAQPQARLTFGSVVSRLQSMTTITLLDQTLSNQSQVVIDLIFNGTAGWLGDQGLQLKPDIAAHVHLLNFNDLQITFYGEAKLDFRPMVPSIQSEWIGGGLQIQWGGSLPRGTARRPRH